MRTYYVDWLIEQGYQEQTCNTQIAHIRLIEKFYGELHLAIENGQLAKLVDEFTYSKDDERAGQPNPTKVEFNGRTYTRLQSLKGAIKRYARFLSDPLANVTSERDTISEPQVQTQVETQKFSLERDMQIALRANVGGLEPGLKIVDEGLEYSVDSGFIDILCEDITGQSVVVELKAGKTDARVLGQTMGYVGDIMVERETDQVRGIIVAHDFDKRTISAARAIPNLSLVKYSVSFEFKKLT